MAPTSCREVFRCRPATAACFPGVSPVRRARASVFGSPQNQIQESRQRCAERSILPKACLSECLGAGVACGRKVFDKVGHVRLGAREVVDHKRLREAGRPSVEGAGDGEGLAAKDRDVDRRRTGTAVGIRGGEGDRPERATSLWRHNRAGMARGSNTACSPSSVSSREAARAPSPRRARARDPTTVPPCGSTIRFRPRATTSPPGGGRLAAPTGRAPAQYASHISSSAACHGRSISSHVLTTGDPTRGVGSPTRIGG